MDAQTIALLAALVLGVVFVVAGAAKVAAGRAWPEMAREMGSPRAVTAALPYAEMAIGALLVVGWQRRAVAAVAGLVLVVFTVQVVLQLRRGRRPRCACFGAWSAKPLGWGHVVRNAALIAVAVVAIVPAAA